tara:strand:+ start:73 stop:234 length:162 start_codon:yes stop_codon:yes gene_type:complete
MNKCNRVFPVFKGDFSYFLSGFFLFLKIKGKLYIKNNLTILIFAFLKIRGNIV